MSANKHLVTSQHTGHVRISQQTVSQQTPCDITAHRTHPCRPTNTLWHYKWRHCIGACLSIRM